MKKTILFLLVLGLIIANCTSCVTARAYDDTYYPINQEENITVVDDVCYVYYTNPTTLFLNTLHIIDGAYYYWYVDKYIPVIFPRWSVWSPHRFFYYDRNHWSWRDRHPNYNHSEYRRTHKWNDYRKQQFKPHNNYPQVRKNTFIPNRTHTQTAPSRGFTTRPSSTRATVNHSGGHTMNNRGGRR